MANILTAYFSMKGQTIGPGMKITYQEKGNTMIAAEFIQKAVGGDLFEIEADRNYSEDHMVLIEEAKQELNAGTRVPVKQYPDTLEQYDTIFLGYPNWWNTMPMVLFTFLEHYDWTGNHESISILPNAKEFVISSYSITVLISSKAILLWLATIFFNSAPT